MSDKCAHTVKSDETTMKTTREKKSQSERNIFSPAEQTTDDTGKVHQVTVSEKENEQPAEDDTREQKSTCNHLNSETCSGNHGTSVSVHTHLIHCDC